MKIAYFSPVSPQKSGIVDYSEKEILPYLSKYMDIDLFVDKNIKPTNKSILENFNIQSYEKFPRKSSEYELTLYNMGNNSQHKYIYDTLLKHPGLTIFHDVYLHGFFWGFTLGRRDATRYIDEFNYCYGKKGVSAAKNAINSGAYPEFDYPLIKRIVDNSLAVVCHSEYGLEKVLLEGTPLNVQKINQPITITEDIKGTLDKDKNKLKVDLRLKDRYPIISSFGFISAHKRYHILLKTFQRLIKEYPTAVLLIIGDDLMGIDEMISNLKLKNNIIKTGYIPQNKILEYLAISDFCVNLRYPTAGETSRSVLQIMAAQKSVIVSNVGWFSEIPDNCCLKLDTDSYEEDTLLEYMKILISDERLKRIIGINAQKYVLKEHDPRKVAQDYYNYINRILNCDEYIFASLSSKLFALGINEEDTDIIKHISVSIKSLL
jgi:glycosyltransferase involved in cell wall biosynthesis